MTKPKATPPKPVVPPELATVGGIAGRMALTALGTYAVTKGYVDADTATTLMSQIGGALAVTGAAGWSYWQKKRAQKQ